MSHEANGNGNGNGKFTKLLLGLATTLAATGIVGTIVMYGRLSAVTETLNNIQNIINKNHAELDKRISRLENDVYTPRFQTKTRSSHDPMASTTPEPRPSALE